MYTNEIDCELRNVYQKNLNEIPVFKIRLIEKRNVEV